MSANLGLGSSAATAGEKLRRVLADANSERVPAVLGVASALQGRIMDLCGVECAFVGTAITVQNYTGFPDTGVASASECLSVGGYIARSVSFPVILDGDTGHGGSDSVRRFVRDAIREGLAGVRFDDQPTDGKLPTQSEGISIVDREVALERYRAAVEERSRLDPSFIIMAQCFARNAVNGGFEELRERVRLYAEEAHVDWVQFEGPHSKEEILRAGKDVRCFYSAMQGRMARPLTIKEHAELGLAAAWYTIFPVLPLQALTYELMRDFNQRGIDAWLDYREEHQASFRAVRRL